MSTIRGSSCRCLSSLSLPAVPWQFDDARESRHFLDEPLAPRMTDRYSPEPLRVPLGTRPLPATWPPPPVNEAAAVEASDVELVAAMAREEEGAAARLYDRHAALVYAVALRVTGEAGDAEDVVAECFAQAWRQASRFDATRGNVAAWLAGIARTRALDLVRARGRREARVLPDSEVVSTAPLPATAPDALAQLETAECETSVARALAALPSSQRDAIALAYWEGLSHAEIAERLATPLGTIKTRIRLGMHKLRELLAPSHARTVS